MRLVVGKYGYLADIPLARWWYACRDEAAEELGLLDSVFRSGNAIEGTAGYFWGKLDFAAEFELDEAIAFALAHDGVPCVKPTFQVLDADTLARVEFA